MVDLAVPRDIEPSVAELEDVYLFSVDDLQQLVQENSAQRELAAGDARLLLEEEVARFLAESRAHDAGPAIRALRRQADEIRRHTAEQARRMLARRQSSRRSRRLSRQYAHQPAAARAHPRAASGRRIRGSRLAETLARLLIEEPGPANLRQAGSRGRYNSRP